MSRAEIEIVPGVVVPLSELSFETARSSGPGGQHVNKTETRVTLVFPIHDSVSLSAEQKATVARRLAGRITKDGALRLSCQSHRSQKANRDEVIERFVALLREALTPRRERKPTGVPAKARRQRLEEKRRTAEKKRHRQDPDW